MRLLIVAVNAEAFLEMFVSQDAGMWETVHSLANSHVDVTIQYLVIESVVVNDIRWEKGQWHFHILVPVEGCFEVHVLDVGASKAGTLGADGTVSEEVQRDHVSGAGGEFKKVVDKVTSNSDADTVRVLLLWAMVDYNHHKCKTR